MNIQIFGTKKSADTCKAERFFKERNIKYQFIDLKEKGMSKGELTSALQAVGGIDAAIDPDTKDRDAYDLIRYLADDQNGQKGSWYLTIHRADVQDIRALSKRKHALF